MATNDKYDRQLRLWGTHGQRALMEASVLLINADATGTEVLKNLVLPGLGSFTILDDHKITPVDVSNNFFVTGTSLGKSRAAVTTELLVELNPGVKGQMRSDGVKHVIETEPAFFQQFGVVVASNVDPADVISLSMICESNKIPLVVVRAMGFLAYCRLQLPTHEVLESHPEGKLIDLRLSDPFPALRAYVDAVDMGPLDDLAHKQVPFVVMLCKAADRWRAEHNGSLPNSGGTLAQRRAEKQQFADEYVKAMARDLYGEENFMEAVKEIHRAYAPPGEIHYAVSDLVDRQRDSVPNRDCTAFSWCVKALQYYMDLHLAKPVEGVAFPENVLATIRLRQSKGDSWSTSNVLPLAGVLPDMTSSTARYLALQEVYASRAAEDKSLFTHILRTLMNVLGGMNEAEINTAFPALGETVDSFCRNLLQLRVVATSACHEEYSMAASAAASGQPAGALSRLVEQCEFAEFFSDAAQTPLLWFLAMRSAEQFHFRSSFYPGSATSTNTAEADTAALWDVMQRLVQQVTAATGGTEPPALLGNLAQSHAAEIVRVGGGSDMAQMHNVAALMGGMASQEIIKIITHQFVPVNNTYVYNGISGCGAFHTF